MGTHKISGDYLMPQEGLIMSSGNPEDFCGNDSDQNTKNWYQGGDANLTEVVQASNPFAQTYDACVIEFEFQCSDDSNTPLNDPQVSFDYIFGSEEYYEYVNSDFNDAFAFFLNGENIAKLPDGTTEVTINTVNYDTNEQYFIGNDVSEANGVQYPSVEADGFTTKLTASATPNSGWNSVKLVIADVADRILDSWVLIEAGSFVCRDLSTGSPSTGPTGALTTANPTSSPRSKPTSSPNQSVSLFVAPLLFDLISYLILFTIIFVPFIVIYHTSHVEVNHRSLEGANASAYHCHSNSGSYTMFQRVTYGGYTDRPLSRRDFVDSCQHLHRPDSRIGSS